MRWEESPGLAWSEAVAAGRRLGALEALAGAGAARQARSLLPFVPGSVHGMMPRGRPARLPARRGRPPDCEAAPRTSKKPRVTREAATWLRDLLADPDLHPPRRLRLRQMLAWLSVHEGEIPTPAPRQTAGPQPHTRS